MRTFLLATVAAASLGIGAAHAAKGNGDPFGLDGANLPVVSDPIGTQAGRAARPGFSRRVRVAVAPGGMVPATDSQGIAEAPNLLPSARRWAACGRPPCREWRRLL